MEAYDKKTLNSHYTQFIDVFKKYFNVKSPIARSTFKGLPFNGDIKHDEVLISEFVHEFDNAYFKELVDFVETDDLEYDEKDKYLSETRRSVVESAEQVIDYALAFMEAHINKLLKAQGINKEALILFKKHHDKIAQIDSGIGSLKFSSGASNYDIACNKIYPIY